MKSVQKGKTYTKNVKEIQQGQNNKWSTGGKLAILSMNNAVIFNDDSWNT